MFSRLPTAIIEDIVVKANDINVTLALQGLVTKVVYDKLDPVHFLLYGQIQSGKTKKIVELINKDDIKTFHKVLVIQNSILVLKQYADRFDAQGVKFQIVDNKSAKIEKDKVTIVMNNRYRYKYFKNCMSDDDKFMLILDESDAVYKRCPLLTQSFLTYHVTATPFRYPKNYFDKVEVIDIHPNYKGIDTLNVMTIEEDRFINLFIQSPGQGMCLVSTHHLVDLMFLQARNLSRRYPDVPVVLLSTIKTLFLNNKSTTLTGSVTSIIDELNTHDKIIIIAHRLAKRGVSYTSSNFRRHLTHQYLNLKQSLTNCLQSLRILGIYHDNPQLTLGVPEDKCILKFERYKNAVRYFSPNLYTKA